MGVESPPPASEPTRWSLACESRNMGLDSCLIYTHERWTKCFYLPGPLFSYRRREGIARQVLRFLHWHFRIPETKSSKQPCTFWVVSWGQLEPCSYAPCTFHVCAQKAFSCCTVLHMGPSIFGGTQSCALQCISIESCLYKGIMWPCCSHERTFLSKKFLKADDGYACGHMHLVYVCMCDWHL